MPDRGKNQLAYRRRNSRRHDNYDRTDHHLRRCWKYGDEQNDWDEKCRTQSVLLSRYTGIDDVTHAWKCTGVRRLRE
jgi:hypothetical protein